jgi:hypothetical protein
VDGHETDRQPGVPEAGHGVGRSGQRLVTGTVDDIAARLENGEDPRGLTTYTRDYIEKLSSEQIRDAARRYLDLTRYARFVLLPEKVVP